MASSRKPDALTIRDEIPVLGSRKKANIGNKQDAKTLTNELRKDAKIQGARSGEDAHENGTKVAILYGSLAERHYDRKTFLQFVKQDIGLARSTMNEWVRVAYYATAAQSRWGIATCVAAGRLIEYFRANPAKAAAAGVKGTPERITDLLGVDFSIDGKRTFRFAGDTVLADDVEDALTFLQGGVSERRGLTNAQRDGNARLREAIATKPALKGVEASLSRRRGKNVLKLVIPSGGNVVEIARLIDQAIQG